MKYINRYKTTSDFNLTFEELSKLYSYLALTDDNQMVHLKPLPVPNILVITTNNTGTTIKKRTDNQFGEEKITLENGENKLIDWNYGFYFLSSMKQDQITSFDLSKYDTSNVTNMSYMFYESSLTSLDLSKFDSSKVTSMSRLFFKCTKLTHIKCKQSFKDWCITNQANISLPEAMVNGTVGNDSSYNWEIVDYSE